ncbi:MAG: DUF99 family protein [Candidatus Altiarchaeota archaeon]|nr:DUF99 family protein [Candidatus Altiarchaeota archaeon]
MPAHFYRIKDEVRILGLDDGPFKRTDKDVLVVGTVFRGGRWVDGIMSTRVLVDGLDATDRISELVLNCRFKDLRVIMLDGLAFGGFNLVDIHRLTEETQLPVIAVVRDMPDFKEIKNALKHLTESELRWSLVEKAGKPIEVETKPNKFIHLQYAGIVENQAVEIVKLSATRSMLPEPIRVAHLIARGVTTGESRGKA